MSHTLIIPRDFDNGLTSFTNTFAMNANELTAFMAWLATVSYIDDRKALFTNPADYIVSVKCYPFDISKYVERGTERTGGTVNGVHFTADNLLLQDLHPPLLNPLYPHRIPLSVIDVASYTVDRFFDNFMDYAPYTKIQIYLPFIGFEDLDSSVVMGHTISIKYAVDVSTGRCLACIILDEDEENIIMMREGNIGINVQIGGGQRADTERQGLLNLLNLNPVSTVANMVTNPLSIESTLTSTLSGMITSQYENVRKGSPTESSLSFYAPRNPYLIITRTKPSVPTSYGATIGFPSMKTATLGDLTGFTQVEDIHIEGIPGTDTELREIESLLKSGVIL